LLLLGHGNQDKVRRKDQDLTSKRVDNFNEFSGLLAKIVTKLETLVDVRFLESTDLNQAEIEQKKQELRKRVQKDMKKVQKDFSKLLKDWRDRICPQDQEWLANMWKSELDPILFVFQFYSVYPLHCAQSDHAHFCSRSLLSDHS
jgi:hypothetical protein